MPASPAEANQHDRALPGPTGRRSRSSAIGGPPVPSMSVPPRISVVPVTAFPPRVELAPSPSPLPLTLPSPPRGGTRGERESQGDTVELHDVAGDDPVPL